MNKTEHIALPGQAGGSGRDDLGKHSWENVFGLTEVLHLVWRRRIYLIAVIAAFLGFTAFQLSRVTPIYTATSTLVLERQTESIAGLNLVATGLSTDYLTLNTQTEVIAARVLLHKIAGDLDLASDPYFNPYLVTEGAEAARGGLLGNWRSWPVIRTILPAPEAPEPMPEPTEAEVREAVVGTLAGSISVTNVPSSLVFAVSAYSPDPEKAAMIANAVADAYIRDQLDAKLEVTQRATEWLSVRADELRARLEESERKLERARTDSQLISEEALVAEGRRLKELRARADDLDAELVDKTLLIGQLELLRADDAPRLPEGFSGAPQLAQVARQLESATGERRDLLLEQFRILLDREIAALGERLPLITEQSRILGATAAGIEAEIGTKSADLIRLRQLEREAEANQAVYEFFLSRMNETSAQLGIQRPDARILSHAVVPTVPTTPRKFRAYTLSLFIGLVVGTVLIVILDRMQTSFRSSRELERAIGRPVMAMIPEAPAKGRRKLLDFMLNKPGSGFVEAVRNLKTSILLSRIDEPPQVVMVTSSTPAEGKTTVSLSLAFNLAQPAKRVILVECDIRRRVFSEYFGADGDKGLVSVVTGAIALEDAVFHHDRSGIDILPAERQKAPAVDLFTSQRFADFIASLRERYDYVVLDTPPVLAVSDPRLIARHCDSLIYAVRWGVTPANTVYDGIGRFAAEDHPEIGFVMTRVNMKKVMQYSYGGYYSYKSYRDISRYYNA